MNTTKISYLVNVDVFGNWFKGDRLSEETLLGHYDDKGMSSHARDKTIAQHVDKGYLIRSHEPTPAAPYTGTTYRIAKVISAGEPDDLITAEQLHYHLEIENPLHMTDASERDKVIARYIAERALVAIS